MDPNEPQYSAGISLDHEDPSIVYLSRPVGGTYEVEIWKTPDGGATWTHDAVTTGSDANNVRPISPRGMSSTTSDLAVVWVHGIYNTYVDYSTSLKTIRATGGNAPPHAEISLSPRSGPAPQSVAFDGSGSGDSDGRIVEYRWDFGDGEQATGAQVRHTYAHAGRYFPTLTVRDDAGAADVAVEEVQVGPSQAPGVWSGPPTNLGDGVAVLTGSVNPQNQPTSYHFEYGLTTAYGTTSPEQTVDPGDTAEHAVSASLSGLQSGASYHYRLVARNSSGESDGDDRVFTAAAPTPSVYRAQVMATSGLIAYWRLGDLSGSTATEELNSHPGTYVGGYRLGEQGALGGDPDTAVSFDGRSGEVTAPGPTLSGGQGTIEGWFYWRGGVVVMRDDTSAGATGWIVAFDNGGQLSYRVGGQSFNTGRSTSSLQGAWHYIAVTNSGSAVACYIDGQQVHTAPAAISTAPVMPWHIMRNGSQPAQFTAGLADEIAIYDRALPASTILAHYQAGIPQAPGVWSGPPTNLGDGVAVLTGSVNPQNQPTSYHFEYGL
ncbi:MAG: PKD domain-containing protein, partial [Acidimicrobiia bacterium]